MQQESVKEYEFIRHELDSLKSCITTYVGFVIGGIGAAVLVGFTGVELDEKNYRAVAYTSLSLTLLLNFVLGILIYKFNSHNRYVGYCMVLGHERVPSGAPQVPMLTWELAMGMLRIADTDSTWVAQQIKALPHGTMPAGKLHKVLSYYTGMRRPSDRWHAVKGVRLLVRAVFGYGSSRSWGFPPVVVAIFFLMSGALIVIGIGTAAAVIAPAWIVLDEKVLVSTVCLVALMYLVAWKRFLGKFHDLMIGSATTSAYAWRFLLIRIGLLKAHGLTSTFSFIDQHLEEELRWIKR